jgi:hypothetical protein
MQWYAGSPQVFLEIGRAIWKKFYAIPEIDLYNVGVN